MAGWRAAAAIVVLLGAGPAIADPCGAPTGTDGYELLDQGYRALYNLDFDRVSALLLRVEQAEGPRVHPARSQLGMRGLENVWSGCSPGTFVLYGRIGDQ
jgi:hypothetical protein